MKMYMFHPTAVTYSHQKWLFRLAVLFFPSNSSGSSHQILGAAGSWTSLVPCWGAGQIVPTSITVRHRLRPRHATVCGWLKRPPTTSDLRSGMLVVDPVPGGSNQDMA